MERTFSGYCRSLDQARIVMAEYDDGDWEIDCDFLNCAFSVSCSIGQQLQTLQEEMK